MIHYFTLLSYGDNVISLSLLSQIKGGPEATIVGTEHTRQIAAFFPDLCFPIGVHFDRVPAFYDVRKRGALAAIRDAAAIRASVRPNLRRGDTIIAEQAGARSRAILYFRGVDVLAPPQGDNVYDDRKALLERVFDQPIAVDQAPPLRRAAQRVLINPASRVRRKAISAGALACVLDCLREHGAAVTLLDPDREHGALRSSVPAYHTGTTLAEAVALLRQADLYLGPDSLMIHLAFRYKIPALILFNEPNLYFAPPGVAGRRLYVEHVSTRPQAELRQALSSALEVAT